MLVLIRTEFARLIGRIGRIRCFAPIAIMRICHGRGINLRRHLQSTIVAVAFLVLRGVIRVARCGCVPVVGDLVVVVVVSGGAMWGMLALQHLLIVDGGEGARSR